MGFNKIHDWSQILTQPNAKPQTQGKKQFPLDVNATAFTPASPEPAPIMSPVPHYDDPEGVDAMGNLRIEYAELKHGLLEEVSVLRKELELLKQGGWCLAIGPWQQYGSADTVGINGETSRLIAAARRTPRNFRGLTGYERGEHDEISSRSNAIDRSSFSEPLVHLSVSKRLEAKYDAHSAVSQSR